MAIMGLTGLAMWIYAALLARDGDAQSVTLTLFGVIAFGLSGADALFFLRQASLNPQPNLAPP